MNSLDNGILLCPQHYEDYNNFYFSIHPNVKTFFIFTIYFSNLFLSRHTKSFLFILPLLYFMALK